MTRMMEELQKLTRLKMSMSGLEKIVHDVESRVAQRKGYLVSPNYIRFGLRAVPAGLLDRVPYTGELIYTGVVYRLWQ